MEMMKMRTINQVDASPLEEEAHQEEDPPADMALMLNLKIQIRIDSTYWLYTHLFLINSTLIERISYQKSQSGMEMTKNFLNGLTRPIICQEEESRFTMNSER